MCCGSLSPAERGSGCCALGHGQVLPPSPRGAKRGAAVSVGSCVGSPASHRVGVGVGTEGEEMPSPRSHSSDLGDDALFKIKEQGGRFAQNKVQKAKYLTG